MTLPHQFPPNSNLQPCQASLLQAKRLHVSQHHVLAADGPPRETAHSIKLTSGPHGPPRHTARRLSVAQALLPQQAEQSQSPHPGRSCPVPSACTCRLRKGQAGQGLPTAPARPAFSPELWLPKRPPLSLQDMAQRPISLADRTLQGHLPRDCSGVRGRACGNSPSPAGPLSHLSASAEKRTEPAAPHLGAPEPVPAQPAVPPPGAGPHRPCFRCPSPLGRPPPPSKEGDNENSEKIKQML